MFILVSIIIISCLIILYYNRLIPQIELLQWVIIIIIKIAGAVRYELTFTRQQIIDDRLGMRSGRLKIIFSHFLVLAGSRR